MVKKLKYLFFLLPVILPLNVFAHPYQLTYNSFNSGGTSYTSSIQSNNNQSIVYNVPFSGNLTNIEWGTTNSPTCSSTAVVSGVLYIDNTAFGVNNNDVGWGRVYIRPSSSDGASNCTFQVSENGTSYVCTASSLSSSFIIGYSLTSATPAVSLNHVITRNVDINCDTSTGQIIDNQNANTQNIINNNTQNTQNIINNNTQNSQNIINNQNQNTQQEIESQKVCYDLYYDKSNSVEISTYYLDNNGNLVKDNLYGVSKYIKINKGNTYIINQIGSLSNLPSYCLYNEDKTLISCTSYLGNRTLTINPTSNLYIRFSIFTSGSSNVSLSGSFCQNGNQALNDSLTGLNDTLNDTSQPNTNQDIQDMDNMVASDTPISDLITMPLTLINAYINGVNSSCSPVNLGNLYGTNLILPCIDLEQRFGSNLWGIIDAFFSLFMCYNIGMLFVSAFDGITSLRDDFEGLYQPRHADTGYQPKHGG